MPGAAALVATVVAGENGWTVRRPDGTEKDLLPNRASGPSTGAVTVGLADEADFLD